MKPCSICGHADGTPVALGFIVPSDSSLYAYARVRGDWLCADCYWWLLNLDFFPPSGCGTPRGHRFLHPLIITNTRELRA